MADREQISNRIAETLNYLFIGIFSIGVWWLSRAFYLGTKETYSDLIQDLPNAFIGRWMVFFMLGFILVILMLSVLWVFEHLFRKRDQKPINLKKMIVMDTICMLIASLVGTMMFFDFL